ncbi:MAG TPA: translocase [Candidatus Binatia bacterium]|nr:translocase [Candidatus Binatia bacterium]
MAQRKSALDRFFSLFADVRAGEAWTALLLMLNLFFLLTAYLIIKTVREPLILTGGGAEVKTYASAGQALLLFLAVPAYGYLATKMNRIRLIAWVTLFFISNLLVFYALAREGAPIAIPFYLWVGVFNIFLVAQFWAFANDLYDQEQGRRLFGIVAFGGSLGAVFGPKIAAWLMRPIGVFQLLPLASVILCLCIGLSILVNRRAKTGRHAGAKNEHADEPLGKHGGFNLVTHTPYLTLIALLVVMLNLVNTTGEYILGKIVTQEAVQKTTETQTQAAAGRVDPLSERETNKIRQEFIGHFYGNFYFWVSLLAAAIQLLLVSRILKYLGAAALFCLPLIALGGYSLIAALPALSYIRFAKIAENSTNYSLQNTTHQTLFLPTSREAKYKAKAAIDTFFVRAGDVLAAVLVFAGARLALDAGDFARVNIVMTLAWLALALMIVRRNRALSMEPAVAKAA